MSRSSRRLSVESSSETAAVEENRGDGELNVKVPISRSTAQAVISLVGEHSDDSASQDDDRADRGKEINYGVLVIFEDGQEREHGSTLNYFTTLEKIISILKIQNFVF